MLRPEFATLFIASGGYRNGLTLQQLPGLLISLLNACPSYLELGDDSFQTVHSSGHYSRASEPSPIGSLEHVPPNLRVLRMRPQLIVLGPPLPQSNRSWTAMHYTRRRGGRATLETTLLRVPTSNAPRRKGTLYEERQGIPR